jgi:hypothetical protein
LASKGIKDSWDNFDLKCQVMLQFCITLVIWTKLLIDLNTYMCVISLYS